MPFVKGQPRPPNAGRKKGSRNKNRSLIVSEWIQQNDVNLVREMFKAIEKIDNPEAKFKSLLEIYKYIDGTVAPKKAPNDDLTQSSEAPTGGSILELISGPKKKVSGEGETA